MFNLKSLYEPTGDQPQAIKNIIEGFSNGNKKITLLGATGTGKTFTMANIIQSLKKPTLVISHNKTLAAQLATEFKYFFPDNAVHYFVSYFDYYQPEAYLPDKDVYIEKDSMINQEIEMYRLSTLASLLSREDVIVVSSVSALYGLGSKEVFRDKRMYIKVGEVYDFKEIKSQLLGMQYKPVQSKVEPGMFDFKGEILDIYSSLERLVYRLIFDENLLEMIQIKDIDSFENLGTKKDLTIWPATQFLQDMSDIKNILDQIQIELNDRVAELKKQGKELEAERLKKKTTYDIRMIKETGYTNGIENYSRYFEKRSPGEPPNTIFDYFPDDMLFIVDESHMSVPQLRAMPQGDKSRKTSLIEHGFRLPSAIDHRPLNFEELSCILGLGKNKEFDSQFVENKIKKSAKTLFVSATPDEYEVSISDKVVEQVIRPTGLLDPVTYVYPKSGDYDVLDKSLNQLLKKNKNLIKYLSGYDKDMDLKDIFL